jgi:glycosyltransferase involved in cell wall biosynthesis
MPKTMMVPSAAEVAPWVETIELLWDDEKLWQRCSDAARRYARRWLAENVTGRFIRLFYATGQAYGRS